jgi:hypothetical protein
MSRMLVLALCCAAGCDAMAKDDAKTPAAGDPPPAPAAPAKPKAAEPKPAPVVAKPKPAPPSSSALQFAETTKAGVCACKDADCGQKLLDAAGEKMPALMKDASADERKKLSAERDAAFACMDALVDAEAKESVQIVAGARPRERG